MSTAHVNGIDIYFEHSGEGQRLLFFNGSGATLERTGPMIDPYRARFEVLVHDQRGLGQSEIPPGHYTMKDYAADALALLDVVGWSSCRVIGVSFGGMVAQEFAVTTPGRVERLVLACTSPGGSGGSSYPLHELGPLDDPATRKRMLPLLDTRFTAEYLADHPADQALASMLAARSPETKTAEQRRGEREQLLARRAHDAMDRLPNIMSPTLVAAGRYDGIAPLANSEAIVSRIPDSELRVYEGGHIFFAQDQRAITEIVDFLDLP
ncbi:MAG TPA: alpha/beta hydrolase [Acidimicrobiales bacterium]|nr:alpha/beta hydrolase [Acidimicrobiales bacterium]